MVPRLAHALHMSTVVFYTLLFGTFIITSLVLGFALNRTLQYYSKKVPTEGGKILLSFLAGLPVPLLLLGSLYLGLESLPLPPKVEHICSQLLFALVILIMMYFPARVIVFALRRAGQRDPHMLRVTQPATFVVQTLFALLGHHHLSR